MFFKKRKKSKEFDWERILNSMTEASLNRYDETEPEVKAAEFYLCGIKLGRRSGATTGALQYAAKFNYLLVVANESAKENCVNIEPEIKDRIVCIDADVPSTHDLSLYDGVLLDACQYSKMASFLNETQPRYKPKTPFVFVG